MAESLCHAAGQLTYEVHEVRGGDAALDLGVRHSCPGYDEAEDFAFEFLDAHDPHREGNVVGLDILEVRDDERRVVFSYRHADRPAFDPTALWGFDVTRRWRGPRDFR